MAAAADLAASSLASCPPFSASGGGLFPRQCRIWPPTSSLSPLFSQQPRDHRRRRILSPSLLHERRISWPLPSIPMSRRCCRSSWHHGPHLGMKEKMAHDVNRCLELTKVTREWRPLEDKFLPPRGPDI
ncbi:hypothetical protein OsI_29564 [Oryza sativa Indica Group]|uniref:Uncharacterized protein n=1 Tax=Oryza sativa subsp. indica TaxID=39946 RepID=A2YW55_ORYSI|nr:hypothetical protein OsI_29564 [Oryza sativa Indica Group]